MEYYRTELALLKDALWGAEHYSWALDYTEDWGNVFKELKDQSVAGITVDAVCMVPGMDPQVKRTWVQFATRHLVFWNKLMKEQDALKVLLDQEEIPFVILKGVAAAMYYPQPEYRTMGDVDLIVKPGDFDRANRILRENGYEWVESEYDRHNSFTKNGIHFELHRYFATFNDARKSRELDALIYEGIEKRVYATVGQYTVPVLPKLENGLVLLAHIDHHLEGGLGLRQIIDWMLFVDRELNDDFWMQEFGPLIKRLDKETLAVTVTRMCQLYLGLREDNLHWCMSADDDLCRDLMEMTITRGNFGQKSGKSVTAISLLSAMSNVFNIPKILQTRGCVNWKLLKKYPFLRPFAWLYQICRYIRKVFSPEYSIGQMANDMHQVKPTQKLLDQLGVRQEKKHLERFQENNRK